MVLLGDKQQPQTQGVGLHKSPLLKILPSLFSGKFLLRESNYSSYLSAPEKGSEKHQASNTWGWLREKEARVEHIGTPFMLSLSLHAPVSHFSTTVATRQVVRDNESLTSQLLRRWGVSSSESEHGVFIHTHTLVDEQLWKGNIAVGNLSTQPTYGS